jgi:hypothetical protein
VAEADFARLVVAGELEKLQGVAGEQLTDAQKQLRALEDQITLLDKQLQAQHDAVDELRGVKLGLTTIESVMSAIHASLIAESAIRQAQTSSAASLSAANLSRPSSLPTTAPVNKFGAATGTRGFFASPLSNYRQISTTEFIDGNGKTRSISGLPLSMETLITASDITGDLQPVIDAARSAGLTPAQVAQAYQQLGRDNTTETSLADWARNTGVVWPELRAATSSWDTTTNTGTLDGQGFSSATAVSTLQDILVNQGVAAAFDAARSTGFSREELSSMVGISQADLDAVADANGIPRLAVGTDYVPRDMFALLHEGERVVPKRYNPSATGESEATHTDPALLLAIKVLIDRVDNLTYQTKRSADAVNGRGEMPQLVKNV